MRGSLLFEPFYSADHSVRVTATVPRAIVLDTLIVWGPASVVQLTAAGLPLTVWPYNLHTDDPLDQRASDVLRRAGLRDDAQLYLVSSYGAGQKQTPAEIPANTLLALELVPRVRERPLPVRTLTFIALHVPLLGRLASRVLHLRKVVAGLKYEMLEARTHRDFVS